MSIQYKHQVAFIYAIALFLDRLDLTIVNITLPTIATVFNVSLTATDFVNLSFLLALAIAIPISSWLGEYFGFKKIFILAMLLFGAGSTLCAFAPNFISLILFRFMHGIGGGLLVPIGMTIVYRLYDRSEYASITSFTFMPSLIAPAIAPFLGGILLDTLGWQSVFLLSGPISLILAAITFVFLKETQSVAASPLDKKGFVLFAIILIDVFTILSFLGKAGGLWLFVLNLPLLVLLIYFFIKFEKTSAHPLINLSYFQNDTFTKANLIQMCFQFCHFGAIFLISMYLQVGVGMSASIAGLVMGMQAIAAIVISRYSVRLFNRNPKLPLMVGLLGVAILSPCILLIDHAAMIFFALSLFFIRGLFSGLCGTPIQTLSVLSFDKAEIGVANTIFNACRQIAISFGVAISSALMITGMKLANVNDHFNQFNTDQILMVFIPGFAAISVVALIGIVIVMNLKVEVRQTQ